MSMNEEGGAQSKTRKDFLVENGLVEGPRVSRESLHHIAGLHLASGGKAWDGMGRDGMGRDVFEYIIA
jgi:hypothetical protein